MSSLSLTIAGRVATLGSECASPRNAIDITIIRSLRVSTFDNSLQDRLRTERSAQEMNLGTRDCVEGVRAFFEKREPHYSKDSWEVTRP